jgi:hypothetical protein
LKNSTFVTDPSASSAVAVIVTSTGAVKMALLAGAVSVTVGGTLSGFTVMATAVEVVVALSSSVARAVRMWLPSGAFVHVKL